MFGKLEILAEKTSILAEGPLWDSEQKTLYYVDIRGKAIRSINYVSGKTHDISLPQQVGTIALDRDGGLVAALEDGIYFVDEDGSIHMAHEETPIKGTRFNDGKAGPDGSLYAGTMDKDGGAAFYRLDPDGTLSELFDGVETSNGLDWSLDEKTLYYIDTPKASIDAMDFNQGSGTLSKRRIVMPVGPDLGHPDGMTLDSQGMLWVALWGGYKAIRVDPSTGSILETIPVPVEQVSCCTFAGDDMNDLIITTARVGEKAEPLAGSVFRIRVDVPGRLPYRFG